MIRGRGINARDAAVGREGVVVNQRFAAMFLAGDEPLGQRLQLTSTGPPGPAPPTPTPWLTIVGVTPTLPHLGPGGPRDLSEPVVYIPFGLEPSPRSAAIVVRESSSAATASTLRDEVRALDADLPLYGIERLSDALARARYPLLPGWFGVLAVIALIVASVGLYAVTAHGVSQRTHEIGIRMALGARPRQVAWLVLRHTSTCLFIGLMLGLGGSLAVGQLLRASLTQISPQDPTTIAAVTTLMALVATAASVVPARRATTIDPAVTLRAD